MKHLKQWKEGNLVDSDQFNGSTKYDSIELNDNEDIIYGPDLSRPLRNIYDTVENIDFITNKLTSIIGIRDGIYPNSFNLTDIKTVIVRDSSNNEIRKHFLRISPGVIFDGNKNISIYPTPHIAERQLHKILKLDRFNLDEKVIINYYDNTDKFDIQIRKNNQIYNFSKGDYGDSFSGYSTGLEAIIAVYNDFSELRSTINENIESIKIENVLLISNNFTGYLGLNENYELVLSEDRPFLAFNFITLSIDSGNLISTQNNDLKSELIISGGIVSSGSNRIRNISGDTLSINVIQSNGDSQISIISRVIGDTLEFDYLYNSNFINLNGDTLSVNTVEVNTLNVDLRLISKLTGDTIELNTLRVDNILGNSSEIITSRRRNTVENISSGRTIIRSDEGKIFNIDSNNNRTINLLNLSNSDNGFTITIRKQRASNNITINPNGSDTINGNSNYILTEENETVSLKWNGNEWLVLSYYIDILPISKGGFGVDTENELRDILNTFTENQGDSLFVFKNHTHNQYLTSVPSQFLTQSEGDGRYYTRSNITSRINSQENTVEGNVGSNLNTLNELASAIDDNPNFYDDIIDDVNNVISQSSGDVLYRQDIIYSGDTIVSYTGDTKSINVSSFSTSTYRWLEVTYSELNTQYRLEDEGPFLYAINNSNRALYTINITLGTSTRVHASNTLGSGNWYSLASHNGTLYAINNSNRALYTINITLGTASRVLASTLGSGHWGSLASHNGTLYTINNTNDALYTINITLGTATRVHASNTLGSGNWYSLASHNGTLYAISDNNDALYTINSTLGTASRVHASNTFGSGGWSSLASHNGTLYASNSSNDALYTINITLGTATRVHATNILGSGSWYSLASHIIPKDSINIDDFDNISRNIYTNRMGTNEIEQSFPVTIGDDALYTIDNSNNALFTINPTLGTASRVHASNDLGTGNDTGNGEWNSLASHNGTLYAIDTSGSHYALFTINSTLGTATRVHASNTLGSGNWYSLTSHNGTLYAINDSNDALYTINPTLGTSTRVHASNTLGSGNWNSLTSHNGTLYAINDNNRALYTINTTLGTASRVHASNTLGTANWQSLTSHNGTLYAINDNNRALYTINPTLGTASRVHASNILGSGNWESLTSGFSQTNIPSQGFYTPNADRLTTWRTSSDSNSRLRFNLVDGTSDIHIHEIVGIP